MTRNQALALIQKKYGKRAAMRDTGKRSGPELRNYHADQIAALGARPIEPSVYTQPKTMTLGEFRELLTAHRAAADEHKKERDRHWSGQHRYRFSVGHLSESILNIGPAYFIDGQGDSWEEALRAAGYKLPEKKARPVPTCRKCDGEHWPFQPCE